MFNGKTQLNDFFDCDFMDTALKLYGLTKKRSYPSLQQVLIWQDWSGGFDFCRF